MATKGCHPPCLGRLQWDAVGTWMGETKQHFSSIHGPSLTLRAVLLWQKGFQKRLCFQWLWMWAAREIVSLYLCLPAHKLWNPAIFVVQVNALVKLSLLPLTPQGMYEVGSDNAQAVDFTTCCVVLLWFCSGELEMLLPCRMAYAGSCSNVLSLKAWTCDVIFAAGCFMLRFAPWRLGHVMRFAAG